MPKIQLLGGPASPFTRKARIALAEKGIDFEWVKASPLGEDNPVVAHNPIGKVPVLLVEGEEPIYDSSVIVEYLEMVKSSPALIPAGGMDRVAVKRWEALGDGICDAGVSALIEKRRTDHTPGAGIVNRQVNKMKRSIAAASRMLGDRQFCHGNSLTLADLAIGMGMGWVPFRMPDEDWFGPYPNLQALYKRLLERPSFASTQPVAD